MCLASPFVSTVIFIRFKHPAEGGPRGLDALSSAPFHFRFNTRKDVLGFNTRKDVLGGSPHTNRYPLQGGPRGLAPYKGVLGGSPPTRGSTPLQTRRWPARHAATWHARPQ